MKLSFDQAKQFGFVFDGARDWITPELKARLAMDAALTTVPNTAVPVEFLSYIDPMVIEILTAPRRAREIFEEEKKGNWTTDYYKFRISEMVGGTEEYSDDANGVTSDVNNEWQSRGQYLFQTSISYGVRELALASAAKISLAADKQKAAANRIDIDANKFYLTGVAGLPIYGILNDPNLPSSITAASTGTGSSPLWSNKGTKEIYDDIRTLFAQLQTQSNGLIDQKTPLKLLISPALNQHLGAATDFNVTVLDMLNKYFSSLEVITVPELGALDGDETIFLIAPKVMGQKSAALAFSEKMRSGPVIQDMSSYRQKFVSTTYGGIVYLPFAFASMTGMA